MTTEILETYKQQIEALELVPDKGGVFEVKIDDDLVYSKDATGEFPSNAQILREIEKRL